MADVIQFDFSNNVTPEYNAGVQGTPGSTLEFDFKNESELQNYTDDEAKATDSINNRLGFRMDAAYRWDLHKYQNLREELSWDIINGKLDKNQARARLESRQLEIQEKYGLDTFDAAETSPYNLKLGKFNFDIGGTIDQVFQQGDIAREMFSLKSIPVGLLSFGVRFAQNQKITAAGAAVGASAGSVVPGAGTAAGGAAGAAVGETGALVKTGVDTVFDVRNAAVFFDTASKEGTDFFYQAYVENGVPYDEAKNIGIIVGLINGASEVGSEAILAGPFKKLGKLIPDAAEKQIAKGVSKAVDKAVTSKPFQEGIKAFGKQFGATISSEIATEVFQEGVHISAEVRTGQLDLSNPEQRQAATDRLVQTGISAAAATLILAGISGGAEVNNKRIEIARQNINGPQVEQTVSAKILSPEEAAKANAEIDAEGVGAQTTEQIQAQNKGVPGDVQVEGKGGTNATDGKIPLPSLKPEEKLIRNKKMSSLEREIKDTDNKISKAEKEYNNAKESGKATKAIEKKLDNLYDTKEKAQSELQDVKSGKKSVKDIVAEEVKISPDKTAKYRKAQIETEVKQTEAQIKTAESELRIAKLGNKSTTRILERLDKLNQQLDNLNNEKAMLESGGLVAEDYRLPGAPKSGKINLTQYRKQREREMSDSINNYLKGVKTGAKQQRTETKQVQNAMYNALAAAGVRVHERGQFASLIKNTQTTEQLAKNKDKFIEKLRQVFENRDRKAAIGKLKALKKSAQKADIDANIRNRMNYLLGLTKMTEFDSGMRQQELENKLNNGEMLTEAETAMLADLQLASGLRDTKGRIVKTSKEIAALVNELENLLATGRTLRQEYLENLRKDKIQKINDAIDTISGAKYADNKLIELFNLSIANIGSMLNAIGGKEFKNKYDPEFQEGRYNQAMYAKNRDVKNEAMKLFKADKYELEKVFREMAKEDFSITLMTESEIKNIPTKISKWHIIDIYNSIKNEDIAQNYFDAYGVDQIFSLVDNLTDAEIKFADYMQTIVQGYYDIANEYNKRKTGKELPKRDNYWMASSNMMDEEYNALDTYRPPASIPSFLKKKARKTVPIPKNAMQKMSKHISQAEYIQHLEQTYVDLKTVFGDRNVRNLVTQKYGKHVMSLLDREIDTLSMSYRREASTDFERAVGKLIGRWAVAKVASPGVGIKQLAAAANYSTEMPVVEWVKYLGKALVNPKKTLDFMLKNSPMLETRYEQGYDDAVSLAISGAKGASKLEQTITDAALSFTKMGDIGAIIFGGNAYVQYRIDQGDSIQEAFDKFERITNKTQQSNNPSSLSQLQKGRGIHFFMKFRNTPNQYARLIVETQLEYMRGEINATQYAKTMTMYTVVQPLLYVYIGAALKDFSASLTSAFGGDDDKKKELTKLETFLDAMNMMITSPIDALPILDEVVERALRDIEASVLRKAGVKVDMPKFEMFQAQMLSDLNKGYKKMSSEWSKRNNPNAKTDFNLANFIYGLGLMQEPFTAIPTKPLFDAADILSGGKVDKAMDTKKKKGYNKSSSGFAKDRSSGFAKDKEDGFAKDRGSGFAKDR